VYISARRGSPSTSQRIVPQDAEPPASRGRARKTPTAGPERPKVRVTVAVGTRPEGIKMLPVVRELRELDPAHVAMFNPLKADVSQMITESDIAMIAEQLAENSTAGIMLIENLWAKKTQQAMLDANGRLVMFERIPHDIVEEALADIAALATTKA
jgi:hypothetical protein